MNRIAFFKKGPLFGLALLGALCLSGCQYQDLAEAAYPQQVLYMPTARNGLYTINSLPPATGTSRYSINLTEKKMIIPLGIYRGGISTSGAVDVAVALNADTVSQLIRANTLAATALLPADRLSLPAAVSITDGKESSAFEARVDLDYLRANPTQKLAFGVTVSSGQTPVNPLLKTTIISIDPAILKPAPNFTARADAAAPRRFTFTNTSTFATRYSWDFGDGSAAVTEASPTYTFPRAGTFTVTLTATGLTGDLDAVKRTLTITVP